MSDGPEHLEELAALPENHPKRSSATRDIGADDRRKLAAAEAEFHRLNALLADPAIVPSAEFNRQLLEAARRPQREAISRFWRPLAVCAAAAAVLLAVWLGWSTYRNARALRYNARASRRRAETRLAWQAADAVLNRPRFTAVRSLGALRAAIGQLPAAFKPFAYDYSGFQPTGYGVYTIGGHRVVLTKWQRGNSRCIMLQMPAGMTPRLARNMQNIKIIVQRARPRRVILAYTVTLWRDPSTGCDWAMVRKGFHGYFPRLKMPG